MSLYDGWNGVGNTLQQQGQTNYKQNREIARELGEVGDSLIDNAVDYGLDWYRRRKLLNAYRDKYYNEAKDSAGNTIYKLKDAPDISKSEYAKYASDPAALHWFESMNGPSVKLEDVESALGGLSMHEGLEYLQSLYGEDKETKAKAKEALAQRAASLDEREHSETREDERLAHSEEREDAKTKENKQFQADQSSYNTLSSEINSLIATSTDPRNSMAARISAKRELAEARKRMVAFCEKHPEFSYPMEKIDKALVDANEGESEADADEGKSDVSVLDVNRPILNDYFIELMNTYMPNHDNRQEALKKKEDYFANDEKVWEALNSFITEKTPAEQVNEWLTDAWEAGAIDRLKGDSDFMTKFDAWYNGVDGNKLDLSRYTAIKHLLGGQPETSKQAGARVDKVYSDKTAGQKAKQEAEDQSAFNTGASALYNGKGNLNFKGNGKLLKKRLKGVLAQATTDSERDIYQAVVDRVLESIGLNNKQIGDIPDNEHYSIGEGE